MTETDTAEPSATKDEADIAADYLEELLDIADLDGDIEIEERNGRSYLRIASTESTDLERLGHPDVVSALQELTRLAVQSKTGEFARLILDIAGSRDARTRELEALVAKAADRIEAGATEASLPPMSSYERKLVHDFVSAHGLVSESVGEGKERYTVIRRG